MSGLLFLVLAAALAAHLAVPRLKAPSKALLMPLLLLFYCLEAGTGSTPGSWPRWPPRRSATSCF